MSMDRTYQFFGFSISHTIFNLPWTILYLPFMLLIPCTFSPFSSLPLPPLFPQLHVMGHTYKFFGFSISHTIFNLPLSILYLPFILLIPCTYSPHFPSPIPAAKPPCDLYFCEYVPVLVVCLVHFYLFIFWFSC